VTVANASPGSVFASTSAGGVLMMGALTSVMVTVSAVVTVVEVLPRGSVAAPAGMVMLMVPVLAACPMVAV